MFQGLVNVADRNQAQYEAESHPAAHGVQDDGGLAAQRLRPVILRQLWVPVLEREVMADKGSTGEADPSSKRPFQGVREAG
jgi:hypothetical protein